MAHAARGPDAGRAAAGALTLRAAAAILALLLVPLAAEARRAPRRKAPPAATAAPGREPLVLPELPEEDAASAELEELPESPGLAAVLEAEIRRREGSVATLRQDATRLLEGILGPRTPGKPRPAEGVFQLAELRWEEAQAAYLAQYEAYEEALAAHEAGKGPKPSQPHVDLQPSMGLYEELLEDHPRFRRLDAVRYLYGFALSDAGREAESLSQFAKILRDTPESPFAVDAHFAVAEHAFAHDDPGRALEHYATVAQASSSPLSDLALYKSAWCHFKLRRHEKAAEAFGAVLARIRDRKEGRLGQTAAAPLADTSKLEGEALRYLAVVFSEIGGAKEAAAFLERIGGVAYRDDVLERLARVFLRQARHDRAADALDTLLGLSPDHDRAPRRRHLLAVALLRLGKEERAIAELGELTRLHAPEASWAKARKDERARKAGIALADEDGQLVAVFLHRRARATQAKADREAAAAAWATWLEGFAGFAPAERVTQGRLARGELLAELGRPIEAAEELRAAAKVAPTDALAAEAAFGAVQAYEQASAAERGAGGKGEASAAEKGLAASAEEFVARFPEDPRGPKVLFAAGRNLYDRGAYAEAAPALARLAVREPATDLTVPAADLALDAWAKAGRFEELEQAARSFRDQDAIEASALGGKLETIAASARFSHAEALEKDGKAKEAAEAFAGVADAYPKTDAAPRALVNAGRLFAAAGEVDGALAAFDRAASGGGEVAAVAAAAAGRLLAADLRFEEARGRYAALVAPGAAAGEPSARLEAGALLAALGDAPAAHAAYASYALTRPAPKDAPEALLRGVRALSGASRWPEAERAARELVAAFPAAPAWVRAEAHLLRGVAAAKQGRRKVAEDALEDAASAARRDSDPRSAPLAARARFERVELDLPAYEAVKFAGGPSALRARLAEKAALLRRLEGAYAEVVTLRDPQWALAALCRVGELYESFARALYDAPLPKGVSAKDAEVYQAALREEAYPIEEKAIASYRLGLDKAASIALVSPWVQRMRERLAALDPQGSPGIREAFPAPDPVDDLPAAAPLKEPAK